MANIDHGLSLYTGQYIGMWWLNEEAGRVGHLSWTVGVVCLIVPQSVAFPFSVTLDQGVFVEVAFLAKLV
jgi:hypothetical protein